MAISDNLIIKDYKKKMGRILKSYKSELPPSVIDNILENSINKRFKDAKVCIHNNYVNGKTDMLLSQVANYIMDKQPIVTSYGVLFSRHGSVPNPFGQALEEFMQDRKVLKKEMFKYPKGSEMFEKYNLLQNLAKIDVNGIYGLIGLYISILYNSSLAPSITAMGRSLISSAIMCFEMFLANNVLFGSLDEILVFIDNVRIEADKWKFNDYDILDKDKHISVEECFYKIMSTSGYKYIPTNDDMSIVWDILKKCSPIELNRLYYKNNLYSFMDNSICRELMVSILSNLNSPYLEPLNPPKNIIPQLDRLKDLLLEYVFYNHQIIDRMDRNKNMIKKVSVISDTDSSFVSMDAWYNYNLSYLKNYDFRIMHQSIDVVKYIEEIEKNNGYYLNPDGATIAVTFAKKDEFGDFDPKIFNAIEFIDDEIDYDFYNDEVISFKKSIDCVTFLPQDNVKFSIINIMAYILNDVINQYMLNFTKNSNSYDDSKKCYIVMKNEFYMMRALLTEVKKHYAALQNIQEGIYLGKDGVLDVKGIDCMAKSSTPLETRTRLKKILLEDILKADKIDQMKVIKDLAIAEKDILKSLMNGSKSYYKPLTVKSINHYDAPLSNQGIVSSIVWNHIKDDKYPSLDLNDRNAVDIMKVNINQSSIEKIKDKYNEQYNKLYRLLTDGPDDKNLSKIFASTISSVAIPKDTNVPEWLLELIDYNSIISDNLSGFPLSSIGVSKMDNKPGISYTNIIKL